MSKGRFFGCSCQRADFFGAQFIEAKFHHAQCQEAKFYHAQLQEAKFQHTQFQGAHLMNAECQGADFKNAECQGAYFSHTQCQGASFLDTQCQGAYFKNTQCQGAYFKNTHCQGAYSAVESLMLEKRIGKNTELDNMIFAGALDNETIQIIELARAYLDNIWYERIQEIIKENEGKKFDYKLPKGIITGVLEDSEEMQAIIAKDWEKFRRIQAEKKKK